MNIREMSVFTALGLSLALNVVNSMDILTLSKRQEDSTLNEAILFLNDAIVDLRTNPPATTKEEVDKALDHITKHNGGGTHEFNEYVYKLAKILAERM